MHGAHEFDHATLSAGTIRHRLNRGGNRRLNAIVYRIVLVQVASSPHAQAYLARRQAEGKPRREAIRALKRNVIRAIWRLLQFTDYSTAWMVVRCRIARMSLI